MAKKLLSLLLAAIMLFSLSAVAFADAGESETGVKQYEHYCSIGDSVAFGIYYDTQPDIFPRIVGRAVGCTDESLWLNRNGMRLKDLAAALHVADYAFDDAYIATGNFDLRDLQGNADTGKYEDFIRQADLITIELGINDVLFDPFCQFDISGLLGGGDPADMLPQVEKFIANVAKGTENLAENYPKVLDRIAELKQGEDYDVVMVGIFNTNNMMDIADEIPVPLGSMVSSFIIAANAIIKQIAEDYGFAYVDITNVPTGAMLNNYSIMDFAADPDVTMQARMTHPAYPEGYQYIARQIIAQLPVVEPKVDTNIRVDLGPVTEVTSVTVGSATLPQSMWSFNPETHMLTVKHLGIGTNVLTVTSKNDGKAIGLYVYLVNFEKDSGYAAHMLYQNNNLTKTAAVIFRGLGLVTSTVVTSIMNLFKK